MKNGRDSHRLLFFSPIFRTTAVFRLFLLRYKFMFIFIGRIGDYSLKIIPNGQSYSDHNIPKDRIIIYDQCTPYRILL